MNSLILHRSLVLFILLPGFCQAQLNSAADSLQQQISIATNPSEKAELLCHLSLALRSNDFEKSLEAAREAEVIAEKAGAKATQAKAISFQGVGLYLQGSHEKALERYLKAIKIYESIPDKGGMALVLNELGTLHKKQQDLERAQQSFQQALDLSASITDSVQLANSMNNLGIVYEMRKDYPKAMELYTKSAEIKENLNDKNGLCYNLDNMGHLFGLMGKYKEAQIYFERVIALRKELGDQMGLAISLNNLGELLQEKGDIDQARQYLNESLVISNAIDFKDLRRHTLSVIADGYQHQQNYKEALSYFTQSASLKDSIFNERRSKQIEELKSQYEAEKKEQEIQFLQQQNIQNRYLIGSLLILVLTLLGVGWLWFNRNRLKQKAERETTKAQLKELQLHAVITSQEEERKRFAADLHDGLGQMISAARLHLINENPGTPPTNENVVSILNDMNTEIRNIAFNLMPQALVKHNLVEALTEFSHRINKTGKFKISINSLGFKENLNDAEKVSLYRVCQEWINNVLKYSRGSAIQVQLIEHPDERVITIEDDGDGFDVQVLQQGKGNGWKNINSRVGLVGGTIDIDSTPGRKGTTFIISIPQHKRIYIEKNQ